MRRVGVAALALVAACGGGGTSEVEAELAAATFVVEFPASSAVSIGKDRAATASEIENRLDVIQPGADAVIESIYDTDPPAPFEFVRDPLDTGSLVAFVEGADRVVAVLYPLINPTPNGRVLSGRLVAVDPDGSVLRTDFDDDGDAAVADLVDWGRELGIEPGRALALAVDGINGRGDARADEAASVLLGSG